MQVRVKTGQFLTEPVTTAEFKTFSGYPAADQDTLITSLITAAREMLELESGVSCISKVYQVEFDRWDQFGDDLSRIGYQGWDDGWYRLPYSPVTLISTVTIGGTATTYSQRGLKVVDIHPDSIIQTGTTDNTLAVEFTAGESSTICKNIILRMVLDFFNHRDDNEAGSIAALSYDTRKMMSLISTNTGF